MSGRARSVRFQELPALTGCFDRAALKFAYLANRPPSRTRSFAFVIPAKRSASRYQKKVNVSICYDPG